MGKKILVVDDEQNILYALRIILELEGYDVTTAQSGAKAIEVLQTEKPALIITDILMPEMDGWELIRRIREELKLKTPIMVLTVTYPGQQETIRKKYDVKAFIRKPFDKKELIEAVRREAAPSS